MRRCLLTVCFATLALSGADGVDTSTRDVIRRMDAAAAAFRSMSANVSHVTHSIVLGEDSKESGTVIMRKTASHELQGVYTIQSPDKKIIAFAERKVQIFYPQLNQVEEYDLRSYGRQVDEFLMIGFGTSGTELAKSYEMRVLGVDDATSPKSIRLELVPRGKEALAYMKKLHLWIPETGPTPYPMQESVFQQSGDSVKITYTDLKTGPVLNEDQFKLHTPPGVKRVKPQQ